MAKKIFIGLFTALILSTLVLSAILVANKDEAQLVKNIQVSIVDSTQYMFVTPAEIETYLIEKKIYILGNKMSSPLADRIESELKKHPFVKKAECYKNIDGDVKVNIWQREPIMRVKGSGYDYYVDVDGKEMKISKKYVAHVLLVNGTITKKYVLEELFELVNHIHTDKFLRSQIEQIYVKPNKELILIPKVGDQEILFGKIENYEEKLMNLNSLYINAFNIMGWNEYTTINLKFKNQVVCTKK